MPASLPFSFTVAAFGKTVAVLWVAYDAYGRPSVPVMATGTVAQDGIIWVPGAPRRNVWTLAGSGRQFQAPLSATFATDGQMAVAYVSNEFNGGDVVLVRYVCTATNGFPCSTGPATKTFVASTMNLNTRALVTRLNVETGYVSVVYFSPQDPPTVFIDYGFSGDAHCLITLDTLGGPISGPGEEPADFLTASPVGSELIVLFRTTAGVPNAILQYDVDVNCNAVRETVNPYSGPYEPMYLRSSMEYDGAALHLFWALPEYGGGPRYIYHERIVPHDPASAGNYETPQWLAAYSSVVQLATAESSSRFIPLLFVRGTNLWYVNWPLPLDAFGSPQAPWSQSVGAPQYGDVGGFVNPATGLLLYGMDLVSIPGRATPMTLAIRYEEPNLFYADGAGADKVYRSFNPPTAYGKIAPGIYLDLPWIDISMNMVHLVAGQNCLISWNGPGSPRWFNNTQGAVFQLKYDSSSAEYTLTMPSGAYYVFGANGRITQFSPTVPTSPYWMKNKIQYYYTGAGDTLDRIDDTVGHTIYTSFDAQKRLTRLDFGDRFVTLDRSGIPPTGCASSTDSTVLTITDVLGRRTLFSVCNSLLSQVEFPTGGKVAYTYGSFLSGSPLWRGTEVYGLPVLQEDVYEDAGAGAKARTTTFTYHSQNGEPTLTQARFYDAYGILQGTREYRYRPALGMASIRILDASGAQMGMTNDWYSIDGQPHYEEKYVGAETAPSVTSQDFVDDWGNTVYAQDASGNETYASYANTNHQYQFYAPGSLKRTVIGKVYATGFDDYSLSGWSPEATVGFDETQFATYMPSLKVSYGIVTKTLPEPAGTVELQVRSSSMMNPLEIRLEEDSFLQGRIVFVVNGYISVGGRMGLQYCGSLSYVAGRWYRLNVVIGSSDYSVYLDGAYGCTRPLDEGAGSSVTSVVLDASATTAWFDDVKVAKGTGAITFTGLGDRQSVALVSLDGTMIQVAQSGSTGTTAVAYVDPETAVRYPIGAATTRIYSADSLLEYQSPFKEFYPGDTYAYTPPKVLDDELLRVRNGFGYWDELSVDDDLPCLFTNPQCQTWGTWDWVYHDAVSWSKVHATWLDAGIREHGYSGDTSASVYSVGPQDFHIQYLYIPSGKAPSQVAIMRGRTSSPDKWASWGSYIDDGSHPINMGPLPPVRDSWIKLIVSGSDLGATGATVIDKAAYRLAGGMAYWDASGRAPSDAGTLRVSGLSGFTDPATRVIVRWANNQTLIRSAYTSGAAYVDVNLYSSSPGGYRLTAFPVLVTIEIGKGDSLVYYKSAPRYLWGGDILDYVGARHFYDQDASISPFLSTDIHSFTLGSRAYAGDCRDSVLCYDMETLFTAHSITLGTGIVSTMMSDLSGSGNDGAIIDANLGASTLTGVQSAVSGLAMRFDNGANYVEAADSASLDVSGNAITISSWVYPTASTSSATILNKEYSYELALNNGVFQAAVETTASGGWAWGGSQPISNNRWTHVAFVYEGGAPTPVWRFYVDGALRETVSPQGGQTGNIVPSGSTLRVGQRSAVNAPFPGSIDQTVVYNRALTAAEIEGLYLSKLPSSKASFIRSTAEGLINETRTVYEGRYLVAGYRYNADGNLYTATDLGSNGPGRNVTKYHYSDFYNGAYLTALVHPDSTQQLLSYDAALGMSLATLTPDCRRIRQEYDVSGRPVRTLYYDTGDPSLWLSLYYDMETPNATFSPSRLMDLSCHGNSGSIVTGGNGFWEGPGIQGKARYFDGTDSVDAGRKLVASGAFSVAAWLKVDGSGTWRTAVSQTTSTYAAGDFVLGVDTQNRVVFERTKKKGSSGTDVLYSATQMQIGRWYHIAATYDGTNYALYVDGRSEATVPQSGSWTGATTNTIIGGPGFHGWIDEVYVFSRAVYSGEVASLSRLSFALAGSTYKAYDDAVPTDGSDWSGSQFHSVTFYDETSTPRRLYLDMDAVKLVTSDGTTVLEDLSGNGNHATVVGASAYRGGKVVGARSFDGTTDYLLVSADENKLDFSDQFTIAGWFWLGDANPDRWGVSKWVCSTTCSDSGKSYLLAVANANGYPAFSIYGDGASDSIAGTTKLQWGAAGPWRFLAVTFDRGGMALYVDGGTSLSAFTKVSNVKRIQDTDSRVVVGVDSAGAGRFMKGGIDEVQIFDRALSAGDIQNLYASYLINSQPPSYKSPSLVLDKSHMTRQYFDGLGRETKDVTADFFGWYTLVGRDIFWNDLTQRSYLPSGQYSTYLYDFLGRTRTVTTPQVSGVSAVYTTNYDDAARKVETIDPAGRKAYIKVDPLGRTIEAGQWNPATSAYGNLTKVAYNAVDLPIVQQDGAQQSTTTYYDALGNPRLAVYPNGRFASLAYDENLRAFQRTDEMGRMQTLSYDVLGRVIRSSLKDTASSSTTYDTVFQYDTGGNLYYIDNGTTQISRVFDSRHRMTQETFQTVVGSTTILIMTYAYDAAGRVTQVWYPNRFSAIYRYDSMGRPMEVNGTANAKYAALSYDGAGRLFSIGYYSAGAFTGITERYGFDTRDRVTQVNVSTMSIGFLQLDYTYNHASDVIRVSDNAGTGRGAKTTEFSYDGQDRLFKATGPWSASESQVTVSYTYDPVGNILSKTDAGTQTAYTYLPGTWNQLDRMSSGSNSVSFEYNGAGSPTKRTAGSSVTTYTYDFAQRLGQMVSGSSTYKYWYDGLGRRVRSEEPSGTKTATSCLVYTGTKLMYTSVKVGTAATNTAYVYVGEKILLRSRSSDSQVRYYHQDLSNNVRLVTYYTTQALAEAKYRYKPFGDRVTLLAPPSETRFLFAGQELDATGLYHMGARYYDASVGRFASRDPIGPGYAYAGDNPIAFYDPTGLAYYWTPWRGTLGCFYDEAKPFIDWWQSLPPWEKSLLLLGASLLFIALAPEVAVPALICGVAVGAALATIAVVAGKATTPEAVFDQFVEGFAIGSALAASATLAVRGIRGLVTVGEELTEAETRAIAGADGGTVERAGVPTNGRIAGVPTKGPRGLGWIQKLAGRSGEGPVFRLRTAGQEGGYFWSRVQMSSKEMAEGFFGRLSPKNLANEAVTAYVKPGAVFWERTARGGLTEIFVNPEDVFTVATELVI